jgi:hypothetical protein
MILRAAFVSLCIAYLMCFTATASQPEGLAGKIITNEGAPTLANPSCPPFFNQSFEWYDFFGVTQLDPTDTLTLEMSIIPFRSGITSVGLDEGANGTTFVSLAFSDGQVAGLRYNRYGWNDVSVQVRLATQDYTVAVNGALAGPFPVGAYCPGGCFSVQAFRLNGSANGGGSVAWIDSLSIVRRSAGVDQPIARADFGACMTQPYVTGGGLVFAQPPRLRSASR